jgi:acyl-CoA synthetase (AMP-forming)/AMP-acid ligase II
LVHDDAAPLDGKRCSPIDDIDPERTIMIYPRAVVGGKLFGIPLSYRNWRAIIATNIELFRSGRYGVWEGASEIFLSAQQIMHGTGFLGTFPFLAMGLPQVIAGTFDLTLVLAAFERHRITATMLVPAMLKSFIAAADATSATRSLRHLLYGGGPISAAEVRAAVDRFGPVLTQVYGRVEGGWPLAILASDDHRALVAAKPHLARSCGQPIAEVEWRLRPLAGEAGDVGELQVKSAMSSTDYVGADGWCSLGDVVRRDANGYLYFERRLDRMINTGYHVYPDEIEAAMARLPGVRGVRIVGEPHERWGEMVVAYVVPSGELPAEELPATLQQALAQRLAKYKVPREFRLVSELPRPRDAANRA